MKKTFILFLSIYIILYPSCGGDEDCESGTYTINKVWTLTEGSEENSNGYYLDYPDGLVTTSTNTINYMPGDDGWFDGLTIHFKLGDNSFNVGDDFDDCSQTTHDINDVFERIYDYSGVYDTIIANYVVAHEDINDGYFYSDFSYSDEQPNIQITGDNSSYDLKIVNVTDVYLELLKSQMDTFTNWWDPLNDTVYWSSYDETRKYSR
ncbi:MAG: hypothetical protein ACJ0QK_00510 [Flavobacteriales bacterium]